MRTSTLIHDCGKCRAKLRPSAANNQLTRSERKRARNRFARRAGASGGFICRAAGMVFVSAAMLAGAINCAHAQRAGTLPSAEACLAANSDLSLGAMLPRTAARLKSGEPLRIVAIGSSSTVGLWVLTSAATYPEVMRHELLRLRSNATIQVINSGRTGDTIPDNIARFQRDVVAHKPDLVVWQLGTNDVAWGGRPDPRLKDTVVEGVRALKAASADVILMDLQYAPMVLRSAYYSTMETIIRDVAKQEGVGLFSRFALMRKSIDAGLSQGALVSWDGLHNTADGYDCIGRALARAISNSTR